MKQTLVLKISLVIRFCHRNLNGLAAHDFVKVSLVETFINTHIFDISYLSETFLDFTVTRHDENIMINSYALLRADHFTNSKRAEVCFYIKEHLPQIRSIDLSILQERLVTEIIIDIRKWNVFSHAFVDPQIKIMRN